MDAFVLSTADELWATIYRKRKNCISNVHPWFDKAAVINQPGLPSPTFRNLDTQDQEVKQIFREFVDYVANVSKNEKVELTDINLFDLGY